MLNHLSWTTYIEIVIFFTAIYYLFVLFRYYRENTHRLLQPQKAATDTRKVPEVLQYQQPEAEATQHHPISIHSHPDNQPDSSLANADELIRKIKKCIESASDKTFAPAILIPQIKRILHAYPDLQDSPHRSAINELIVQECESTGTTQLTEEGVDQWWPG